MKQKLPGSLAVDQLVEVNRRSFMSSIASAFAGLPFVGKWFGGCAGGGKSRALCDCCEASKPAAYEVTYTLSARETDCDVCYIRLADIDSVETMER